MFRISEAMSLSAGEWSRDGAVETVRQEGKFMEFIQSNRIRCS